MKRNALMASAFALTVVASPAKALDADHEFMGMLVMAAGVINNCPGYQLVPDGLTKFGDLNGADIAKYGPPSVTALLAISGEAYDRKKLVPAVTQFIRANMLELGAEVIKLGKPKFCEKYAPAVVNTGIVKKKDGEVVK